MSASAPDAPVPAAVRASRSLAIALIRLYQLVISPLVGPSCRYQPSCSAYVCTAITRRGVVRGAWLGARRIGRCHPWGGSGYDPVP